MIATAKRQVTVFLGLLMLLGIGTRVLADTGVSDERVVLPDGPGSIGGVGENAEIDPNMGMMRYSIKIETPAGFNKVTPSLSLSYGSGSGSSVLGIGWSMSLPHIERMSLRGLPEYGTDDEFAVNGSDELVEVGTDGTTLIFRNRFEKGFIRYKWHEPGDGKGGYFTAEYPDGTVSYFGADQEGDDVATSRVSTADGGVFRYHLVETVDPYGHRISYTYVKHGDFAVIDEIGYVFTGGATPRFSVKFTYEDREDVLSDCVPGFNLLLTKRMSGIQVLSGATQVKRYALTYEEYTKSGGFTRLAAVKQYGVEDELHPINFSFGYSRSLGGACESDCEGPYMVDMGTLPGGVDISTGRATLLDINGDALPDVLNTTNEGIHSFYISEIGTDGNPGFTDTVVESTSTTSGSSFVLNAPGVQVLDVNGDGFTDIISSRVGDVLCNTGAGDWTGTDCIANSTLPQMDEDGEGDANPLHVRFMDYDNDKRIDMIRTNYGSTEVFHNTGGAFTSTLVDEMGAVFDDSTLQLTDMNGDNLQDPVEILAGGQIRYKLNLGFGKWTDWVEVTLSGIGESALLNAKLEDINGDSLSDIVVVLANEVSYSINRNGTSFDPFVTLTSDEVTGDVPENNAETSVLFADMNGNGSRDIVWITNGGAVKFLELFPVKPNLISRISNGIGSEQLIEYGTSVAQQARDKINAPWQYKLPYAMNLVIASDQWVTLTGDDDGQGLHSRVEYVYHDGYYDGAEKTFRGYEDVEVFELADMTQDSQEPGLAMMHYDVGASDPYYNGLLLSKNIFAGEEGSRRELERQTTEYEDCEVAGVPTSGLRLDVRHVCETANQIVIIEGSTDNKEWVTKRTELGYDGYGNANQKSALGVIHYGPPDSPVACVACGSGDDFGTPCGASCTGDEFYTEIDFVEPGEDTGGLWLLGSQYRKVTYGSADGPKSETLTYYDGEAYQGLTLGTMTKGLISSVSQKEEEGKEELIYSA
ncbi:MAG: hypothetical protein GY832_08885, partial [Chloroflexi bacterium]|nr:hypothetical protein [Chloroflexota bacterium]